MANKKQPANIDAPSLFSWDNSVEEPLTEEYKPTTVSSQIKDENQTLGPERKIDDWGEKLEGARKFILREIADQAETITEAMLIAHRASEVFKKPNFASLAAKGEIKDYDAIYLEGLSRLILHTPKPRVTSSPNSFKGKRQQRELEAWAHTTKTHIDKIKSFIEASPDKREEIINALDESTASPAVIYAALKEIGFPSTDVPKFKIPEVKVYNLSRYVVDSRIYETARAAKSAATRICKATVGQEIDYGPRDFLMYEKYKSQETGRYSVWYFEKSSSSRETCKSFTDKEQAEAFVQSLKESGREGVIQAEKQSVSAGYLFEVRDPVTGKGVEIPSSKLLFPSPEEARTYIEENIEDLSTEANEVIIAAHSEGKAKNPASRLNLDVYYNKQNNTYSVWIGLPKVKSFGNMITVADGFKDWKTAKSWAEAHREELHNKLTAVLKKIRDGQDFTPDVPRIGPSWRSDRNITEEEFGKTFGFRGVQFGNWADQESRQRAINEAYDGLMDMSSVLGLTPESLSLDGELGIAFGSRGSGKASAHYELNEKVINLTKTRGAGSLAHEWWHAFDNYFGRSYTGDTLAFATASENKTAGHDATKCEFGDLRETVEVSGYYKRNQDSSYFGAMSELTARAFAEYVKTKIIAAGGRNEFMSHSIRSADEHQKMMYDLVNNITGEDQVTNRMTFEEFKDKPISLYGYRYPTPSEQQSLNQCFDSILGSIIVNERYDSFRGMEAGNGTSLPKVYEAYKSVTSNELPVLIEMPSGNSLLFEGAAQKASICFHQPLAFIDRGDARIGYIEISTTPKGAVEDMLLREYGGYGMVTYGDLMGEDQEQNRGRGM